MGKCIYCQKEKETNVYLLHDYNRESKDARGGTEIPRVICCKECYRKIKSGEIKVTFAE